MRSVVVLLAATLLGADRPKDADTPVINYDLKILDMDGVGWRSALHSQLNPVARQGSATVWTASREAASKLAEKAVEVVAEPRLTSQPQIPGTVLRNSVRRIVGEVIREADGPVNHASFVGYVPRVENATEGYSVRVVGRSLDQGVLANLSLEDRQVTSLHTVALTEVLESKTGKESEKAPVKMTIQIPEYARTTVSGEWLIPKEGVLVVSLGVHTGAGPRGKAVVRERLVVVAAETSSGQPGALSAILPGLNLTPIREIAFGRPAEIALPLALPALPGRSLPKGFDAQGLAVALPPLPEGEAPVTSLPGTSEPCATPQAANPVATGEPIPWKEGAITDQQMNLTGFRVEPPCGVAEVDLRGPKPSPSSPPVGNKECADDKAPPCCEAVAAPTVDDAGWKVSKFMMPFAGGRKIEGVMKVRLTPAPVVETPN